MTTEDRLAEIESRSTEAVAMANYGGRPDAAEQALVQIERHYSMDVPWLLGEVKRLQHELARYEAEIARLRECRDKAASLMHLANQAMYGLAD